MSDAPPAPPGAAPGKSRKIVPLLATVVLAAGGFASTYLGVWSPTALFAATPEVHAPAHSAAVFVTVPAVELNIPGSRGQNLILSAVIETDAAHSAEVSHLMPRVRDAFFGFLSGIDPSAFDKRGVLEIIRTELVTRSRFVLGESAVNDLLITEFRIR